MSDTKREREREKIPPPHPILVFSFDAAKKLDDFRIIKTQRITRGKRKKKKSNTQKMIPTISSYPPEEPCSFTKL